MLTPSSSMSPASTVYENFKVLLPLPSWNSASFNTEPTASFSTGESPVTYTGALNLTWIRISSSVV